MKQNNSNKKKPKFNREKQDLVVDLITDGATFIEACQKAKISRTSEWRARQNNDI